MAAHRHTCPHGAWTCSADNCHDGSAQCGTCVGIPTRDPSCDRCHAPVPERGKYLTLCDECAALIEDQLTNGKFLG